MASMIAVTKMMGPAHSMMVSPYSTIAQKPATRRKLSHGSPDVHETRPRSLFKGSMYGCEKARALVTVGGVATSKGDLRCMRTVVLALDEVGPYPDCGEKAAAVVVPLYS